MSIHSGMTLDSTEMVMKNHRIPKPINLKGRESASLPLAFIPLPIAHCLLPYL